MKFPLALMVGLFLLSVPALEAAVYKGQKEYVKKCRKCHYLYDGNNPDFL